MSNEPWFCWEVRLKGASWDAEGTWMSLECPVVIGENEELNLAMFLGGRLAARAKTTGPTIQAMETRSGMEVVEVPEVFVRELEKTVARRSQK